MPLLIDLGTNEAQKRQMIIPTCNKNASSPSLLQVFAGANPASDYLMSRGHLGPSLEEVGPLPGI